MNNIFLAEHKKVTRHCLRLSFLETLQTHLSYTRKALDRRSHEIWHSRVARDNVPVKLRWISQDAEVQGRHRDAASSYDLEVLLSCLIRK